MQAKFPNLDNFENENLATLLKNYKALERKGKDSFFHYKQTTVLFPEINQLIQQKTTSTNLWFILIDFLISYSYHFRYPVALFNYFWVKQIDNENIDFENLGESLEQIQEHDVVKEVILVKLVNQYFLILQIDANTYIVDYAGIDETLMKQLCNFFLEQPSEEIRLIGKQIAQDSSSLLFQFLALFVSGRKVPSILLNEYDLKTSLNRQIWFFLRMGFDEIDRVFKEGLEYEQEQKQQRIMEYKRRRLESQIRNQRKEDIEPLKQPYRLRTPLDAQDMAEQQKLLKERMAYLKVLCGEGNDEDILQSEMFQLRKTNLERQVDEELKQLDTLKQQQIKYSGNPLLRNASELLKGKLNENLFKNLGLEIPDDFNKSSILKSLKQQNYDSILKPLIEKRQPIPGVFVPVEHIKNIVNYRYNIKVQTILRRSLGRNQINFVKDILAQELLIFILIFWENIVKNKKQEQN